MGARTPFFPQSPSVEELHRRGFSQAKRLVSVSRSQASDVRHGSTLRRGGLPSTKGDFWLSSSFLPLPSLVSSIFAPNRLSRTLQPSVIYLQSFPPSTAPSSPSINFPHLPHSLAKINMSSPFAYDSLFKQYSGGIPCPSDFNFATHIIDKWARTNASLPALHFVNADFEEDRVVSYGELSDLSHRAARVFSEAGLKKGDRCVFFLFFARFLRFPSPSRLYRLTSTL